MKGARDIQTEGDLSTYISHFGSRTIGDYRTPFMSELENK